MPFNQLIETLKQQYETHTGWGDSRTWANQDFIKLSALIQQRTGVTLSHVTLKRIWGKVKYDSLPNTYTLDTLVHFLGFEDWRSFASAHQKNDADDISRTDVVAKEPVTAPKPALTGKPDNKRIWQITAGVALLTGIVITYLSINKNPAPVVDADYTFSSKKVVTQGVPNSVIFDYGAAKAPGDSVIIQQSWDTKLRQKVSKWDKQHTSIYYYPDYYRAKLIVNNKIVKQHDLLIKSNGWVAAATLSPVPVYFDNTEVMRNGKMGVSAASIAAHNIKMQPSPPFMLYSNVQDFGPIYSDDFVFETSIRNDYKEGSAVCQQTHLYILCEGTAIAIPLCAKGCVSDVDLIFTDHYRSGKKTDLSMFGTDLSKFVKVRVEAHNKIGKVYLDDKLVYTASSGVVRSKIIGIDYSFQGTGSVDYVKLSNGKVNYVDEF
ncbi:hypothetical protein BC343_27850 [Mucilaginibacter pedocola]|uniref:Uncharacterized protein n=2 Tax=Mucilaginibacter pedocola TaxID=1792845 RepID=A0A1S9PG73_9SPHI|nr:hypothetical protein BC343_27850 [Mucilaginibacter pedocola]